MMLSSSTVASRKRSASDAISDVQDSDRKKLKSIKRRSTVTSVDDVQHSMLMQNKIGFGHMKHLSYHANILPSTPSLHFRVVNVQPGASVFQGAHHFSIGNGLFLELHHGDVNIQTAAPNNIEKYRRWLMPSDTSTNHNNAIRKHHKDTGLWLFEHAVYKDWKRNENSFMWVHGISGAGKTILFSTIVEDIQSISQRGSIGLGYFYCDVSDSKKRNVTDIIKTLIVYLLTWQPSNWSLLEKSHEDCADGLLMPSDDKLHEVLKQLLCGFEIVYILIDALDECLEWGEVFEFIKTLHGWNILPCHLLVTSRKEQHIVESMASIRPMEIDLCWMPIDDDIKKYIDSMLHSSLGLKKWGTQEKYSIKEVLSKKAKGMFRWVACQLDELKKCTRRRKALDFILEKLPDTLEATYDQVLNRVSPADASDAVKLLLWLAFAEQPLHIDHLAVIVQFDMNKGGFNLNGGLSSPRDVLKICSSLVTVLSDNTVQLAHASVRNYVLEKRRTIQSNIVMDPSSGDSFVGQCCLSYLLHSNQSHPLGDFAFISQKICEKYQQSLIRYAAKYWPLHILRAKLDEMVIKKMKRLFMPTSFAFQNWVEVYNYDLTYISAPKMKRECLLWCASLHGLTVIVEWLLPGVARDTQVSDALAVASLHGHINTIKLLVGESIVSNGKLVGNGVGKAINSLGHMGPVFQKGTKHRESYGHALQAASKGGHKKIVQFLLDRGADVNAQGGEYGNALQAASEEGHKDIVELLLARGVDMNVQGGSGSALQAASQKGHKEIVQLLLEHGADVNVQSREYGTALHASSQWGHFEIVKLLLEAGADVSLHGGQYGYALQAASQRGYNEIVQLLLKKGANVNEQGGEYGNALQAATQRGHYDIVHLLLENGADVNVQGGPYGNALQAASQEGYKEIVSLLLERGANVNAEERKYGNALQVASQEGHTEIAKQLLGNGADVNAQGGEYGNALQAASQCGNEDIVQLLLDKGANVNAQGGLYGNALQAASQAGYYEIVQVLLDRGADANAQGGEYVNALCAAAQWDHYEVVKILLKQGVNVNAPGGKYGTALQAACQEGHNEIIQLLLENGANVNTQGGEYGDALQTASHWGDYEIVQLLLERGADVNGQGGKYRNALQAASEGGYKDIVQLLLEKGADVNAQGGEYGNALQAASQSGDIDIVQLLLERGANVDAQGGPYGNALHAASQWGHTGIVQLLLDKGANANATGGQYGSALHAASQEGHKDIVKLLLEKGANVNTQAGQYGNALHAASQKGHNEIVGLLLEAGADVNAKGGPHASALLAAAQKGHAEVVQLLLKGGADVNAQGGEYGNALQAAAQGGSSEVVNLLIKGGAHLNSQGGKYGNALQAAAFHCHIITVDILLQSGAKITSNYVGQVKWWEGQQQVAQLYNSLQAASLRGDVSIVKLLLRHGVEKEHLHIAIYSASHRGHMHIVDLLLKHKAMQNL